MVPKRALPPGLEAREDIAADRPYIGRDHPGVMEFVASRNQEGIGRRLPKVAQTSFLARPPGRLLAFAVGHAIGAAPDDIGDARAESNRRPMVWYPTPVDFLSYRHWIPLQMDGGFSVGVGLPVCRGPFCFQGKDFMPPWTSLGRKTSNARFFWAGRRTSSPMGRAIRSASCSPDELLFLSMNTGCRPANRARMRPRSGGDDPAPETC